MKLFEEFRVVEDLWEDAPSSSAVLKTFGRKTYDISKKDELEDWVNANVEFQMKRYPDRYSPNNDGGRPDMYPEGKFNAYSIRSNVLNNLLDSLVKDSSTETIRDNIWELITANARESSKNIIDFQKAREAEAAAAQSVGTVEEAKSNATRITKAELKEMIKEALREALAAQ